MDMDPHSDKRPEQPIDWSPAPGPVHESPDSCCRSEGGCACLCASCGFGQTQGQDSVGRNPCATKGGRTVDKKTVEAVTHDVSPSAST